MHHMWNYGEMAALLENFSTSMTPHEALSWQQRNNDSQPVNLGSGDELSIANLALAAKELVGYKGEIRWDATKPNGQPRRKLCTIKAQEKFGFSSQVGLKEGLKETVEWYVAHAREQEAADKLVAR